MVVVDSTDMLSAVDNTCADLAEYIGMTVRALHQAPWRLGSLLPNFFAISRVTCVASTIEIRIVVARANRLRITPQVLR